LAKHDEDDLERSELFDIHAHFATTIDRKAEFVQEDETGDPDKAAEKDSDGCVYPEWANSRPMKYSYDIENGPGLDEAAL
jgi:hypothetical protein